jgi:hypothetical protein
MKFKNYWSCSNFANLIRGIDKPRMASLEEWDKWNAAVKESFPFRYWMAEVFLDKLEDVVMYPINNWYNVIVYLLNRFIYKYHSLTANPKHIMPGKYKDFDKRIFFCIFDAFVDFVEIELALTQCYNKENQKKYKYHWYSKFFKWRNPDAGIDYLKWKMKLKNQDDNPSCQAIDANEILNLYNWYVNIYPNRPDSTIISGWHEYCSKNEPIGSMSDDEKNIGTDIYNKMSKIEEDYYNEDNLMLCKLMNIRRSLWS